MSGPAFADAVRALVSRCGGDADRVEIVQRAAEPGAATIGSFASRGGILTLTGTDAVAAASAFAAYLRRHGRRVTWEAPAVVPFGDSWLFELRAVRTDFLRDAAVPVYYTFGADLVYRTFPSEHWSLLLVPDDFQIGLLCDTDLKSYNSFGARAAIRWKW